IRRRNSDASAVPQGSGELRGASGSTKVVPAKTAPPPPVEPVASDHRVLIVNEEPGLRHPCSQMLRVADIPSDSAPSPLEAPQELGLRPYSLILLDLHQAGGISGLDFCRELRENSPCPNFKIVTTYSFSTAGDLAKMLLTGVDDFLAKPFSMHELQA